MSVCVWRAVCVLCVYARARVSVCVCGVRGVCVCVRVVCAVRGVRVCDALRAASAEDALK